MPTARQKKWVYFCWLLLIFGATLLILPFDARAQDPVIWSKAENLSLSPTSSRHPAIVADDYGNVHVFWSEELLAIDPDTTAGGSGRIGIMYMRWDGERWTLPVDILVSPGDARADFIAVDIAPDGRLHAVWGGQSDFYYSTAFVSEADNPNAWDEPKVLAGNNARSSRESSITIDEQGVIHVIYATRGSLAGVYHISSLDGGTSWRDAQQISGGLSSAEAGFANVRIVNDSSGRLHATWQTFEEEGFGQGVYYSRSLDGGQTWEEPIRFAYREGDDNFVALPYVVPQQDDVLHLVYVDGNDKRRAYHKSLDGGATWSEPEAILTDMEGVNSYVFPVFDANQRAYMIVNMRTQAGQRVGIYYSYQLPQGGWSQTKPVDVNSPGAGNAHSTAAAVRLGNEIHIVYNQFVENEIWHVRGEIQDVAQIEALPMPEMAAAMEPAVQQPTAVIEVAQEDTENAVVIESASPPSEGSQIFPILAGFVAALLLIIVIIMFRSRLQRA